ncbi:MAG: hypothetical protein ACI9DC_003862, partial [Gammaproteobacteria bacterium]
SQYLGLRRLQVPFYSQLFPFSCSLASRRKKDSYTADSLATNTARHLARILHETVAASASAHFRLQVLAANCR